MHWRGFVRVAVAGAVAAGSLAASPIANAEGDGPALNGTYRATSIGNFARTNQVFIDEATVQAIWTISTTCDYPTRCVGKVSSNQGWTERIAFREDYWEVFHEVPNWIPCSDGSTAPGRQVFVFVARDANGQRDDSSTVLGGTDTTTGPSGACGVNKAVEKTLPFRLEKIG